MGVAANGDLQGRADPARTDHWPQRHQRHRLPQRRPDRSHQAHGVFSQPGRSQERQRSERQQRRIRAERRSLEDHNYRRHSRRRHRAGRRGAQSGRIAHHHGRRTRRLLRLHTRTQRSSPRSSACRDRLFLHGDMSGRFRLPRAGGMSSPANSAAAARLRSEGLCEFPAAALGPAAAPQSDLDRDEPVGPRHRPHRAPSLCGRSPVIFPGCGCQRSLPRHASPSHLCASTGQAHRLPDARWPQCLGRAPHRGLQPDHASARHQDPVAHR